MNVEFAFVPYFFTQLRFLHSLLKLQISSMLPFSLLLSSFLSLTSAATIQSRATACNNSPDLCSRAYNSITHLGAHDSPFVRDATTSYSTSGNQYYNSTVQLSAGVRLLSAQVHQNNGDWHLCHSSCDLLDAGLLSAWLADIKTWMDANPNDVVTVLLVNSDNATPAELHAEFTTAGITDLAYKPASTSTAPATWPTLQDLITAGTRLMTFVASLDDPASIATEYSYLMDEFTFIFENPYENTSASNFTCAPDRPTGLTIETVDNRMAFMNHFLYESGFLDIETPNVDNITFTNSPNTTTVGQFGYSLNDCKGQYGKAPVFTLLDFVTEGPAINAVDAINGITPTGRTQPPAKETTTTKADSSFAAVQALVEQVKSGSKPSTGAWLYAGGSWQLGGINLSGGDLITK